MTTLTIEFFGGPHDGRRMKREDASMLQEIRFAIPGKQKAWHAYEMDPESERYVYIGQVSDD